MNYHDSWLTSNTNSIFIIFQFVDHKLTQVSVLAHTRENVENPLCDNSSSMEEFPDDLFTGNYKLIHWNWFTGFQSFFYCFFFRRTTFQWSHNFPYNWCYLFFHIIGCRVQRLFLAICGVHLWWFTHSEGIFIHTKISHLVITGKNAVCTSHKNEFRL